MKTHLQCGYEDDCKNKDCLKCPKRRRFNLYLTMAEQCIIEDFAICDLKQMIKDNPEEVELMQNICCKIMKKIFNKETQE